MSEKSAREVAFLRDLYIDEDWTARFTKILDENLILPEEGSLLYIEPGSGNHLLGLPERLDEHEDDVKLYSAHENIELLRIAQAKAAALRIKIDFEQSAENRFPYPDEQFTTIIADASFLSPQDIPALLGEIDRILKKDGHASFFLPTAGSFGEFFSLLWEAFFNAGLEDRGSLVEELIRDIPVVTDIEAAAKTSGLKNVKSVTKTEYFDYENGTEFVNSFLATDFLLPRWMRSLTAEEKEKIVPELIRTIDEDRGALSFRLTLKATVFNGKKS
jgi:ubiquinone/menaquinone biosynthesis C-methylase UbiE